MPDNWKNQLKHVYKNLQQEKKNQKGFQSRFDNVRGYKNKVGFSELMKRERLKVRQDGSI